MKLQDRFRRDFGEWRSNLPPATVRFARAGHPQLPDKHFRDGNSLAAVNELLEEQPIRWV